MTELSNKDYLRNAVEKKSLTPEFGFNVMYKDAISPPRDNVNVTDTVL